MCKKSSKENKYFYPYETINREIVKYEMGTLYCNQITSYFTFYMSSFY